MSTRRTYRRTAVKKVNSDLLLALSQKYPNSCPRVGLDIGKREIVVVIRWPDESFESPWSVENPGEISKLVDLLVMVHETCGDLCVGMESTGTYGEAVRRALTVAGLTVHRISGKAASDYKEIFDGVPSQHDGKDAAIIAELAAYGKGTPWPYQAPTEQEQKIAHQTSRLEAFSRQAQCWGGRLEALTAQHWPELSALLSLTTWTALRLLSEYGSPQAVAADPDVREKLRTWSRNRLTKERISDLIDSAKCTEGVPPNAEEAEWYKEVAEQVYKARREVEQCEKRLEAILHDDADMASMLSFLGATTLAMVLSTVGDPKNYGSSGAFLKAMGLNLKELSSGQRQGQRAITKRGSRLARKYLFYWALRMVNDPAIATWYTRFKKVGNSKSPNSEHRKMKGINALTRKLARALWYTRVHDLEFDPEKVFPGRPLDKPRRRRRRPPQ